MYARSATGFAACNPILTAPVFDPQSPTTCQMTNGRCPSQTCEDAHRRMERFRSTAEENGGSQMRARRAGDVHEGDAVRYIDRVRLHSGATLAESPLVQWKPIRFRQ